MVLRQCEKCSEMVDEAKAFCPGCGHSFVSEEKRSQRSNFDTMEGTMQLGQTMYNQMLTDMGLNISKAPDLADKPVELTAPVATKIRAEPKPAIPPRSPDRFKWVIIPAAVAAILFLIAIAAVVSVYWFGFG